MVHSRDTFWDDPAAGTGRSYGDLLRDLNDVSLQHTRVDPRDPYELFLRVLHALAVGYRIDILDEDAPPASTDVEGPNEGVGDAPTIGNWRELIRLIESHSKDPLIGLSTSGTTGEPKWVAHSFASLTRGVKTGERYGGAVWALAYHPSHIAAMHVFFQAFLNGNPIVYVFPMSGKRLLGTLEEKAITHVSATPTFYRQMLLADWSPLSAVRVASCGGEPLSSELHGQIEALFPNARIRNIYALTEAGSLFASDGETFAVSPSMQERVRISDDGELLLHRSLLADMEDTSSGEWYHTGDIVERTESAGFRIVRRASDLINVGGFSVDPHEVERVILQLEGVVDVVVRGRPNRLTGNVLEAVVVKDVSHSEPDLEERIYRYVKERVQPHKVPRIVRFAPNIELTRTGKKARR